MNESIVDFRFYTYLPVNKVDGSYSDDEGFYLGNILWRSILVQLKKKFEEKQTDNHRYADVYIGQMLWAFLTQENF